MGARPGVTRVSSGFPAAGCCFWTARGFSGPGLKIRKRQGAWLRWPRSAMRSWIKPAWPPGFKLAPGALSPRAAGALRQAGGPSALEEIGRKRAVFCPAVRWICTKRPLSC